MQELGEAERSRLLSRFGRTHKAGAMIYSEGEEARTCFLLHEGRVQLFRRVRGKDRNLSVLRPSDIFGEDGLLDRASRSASALALTDVTVLALDRRTFGVLLASNPEVAGRLVEQLVRRLRDVEEQLENSMLGDALSRVLNTLLRLAASAAPGTQRHEVLISPLDLSSRVGLDVDQVKRAVQRLRDGGHVQISEERIVIADVDALRRLYELLGTKEEIRDGI